jgi:formylglycine-generating enzyme required for sulfatase activity
MGSPVGELGRQSDEAVREVTLSRALFVQKTEDTQGQWKALSGGVNPSCFQTATSAGGGSNCTSDDANDGAPVEQVSWWSALGYLNALSVRQGLRPCYELPAGCTGDWRDGTLSCGNSAAPGISVGSPYECRGYRLPTEAEWEFAARAGTTTSTYAGNLLATTCADTRLLPIAWFCGNAASRTQPIGGKAPNDFGLYDMLGNVREWVWDRYAQAGNGGLDPEGALFGDKRVMRGGAWSLGPDASRAAHRASQMPELRDMLTGFRPVRMMSSTVSETAVVTFDAQGGGPPVPTSRPVTLGEPYGDLPATIRDGHVFAGWWTAVEGGSQILAETPVSIFGDHFLYARWTRVASTDAVEFAANASYISVSTFSNGHLSVLYRDDDNGARLSRVVYSNSGEVTVTAAAIAGAANGTSSTTLSTGNVGVVFSDADDGQSGNALVLNEVGTVIIPPTRFATFANQFATAPLRSGKMFVAYGPFASFVIIDAQGVASAPAAIDGGQLRLVDATTFGNGRVLAAWSGSSTLPWEGAPGRFSIFDDAGTMVVPPTNFDTDLSGSAGNFDFDVARFGPDQIGIF